jgi:hypothetical protein
MVSMAVEMRREVCAPSELKAFCIITESRVHHAAEHRDHRHRVAQVMGAHRHQLLARAHGFLLAAHLSCQVVFQCRAAQVVGGEQVAMAPFD